MHVKAELPPDVRCAVALSHDTDMAGGYAPDGVCHGRTMPALADYMLELCDTAEAHEVRLHFFQIGNGLEEKDIGYLEEILRRGHVLDSHTHSHISLITDDVAALDEELERTNRLFEERLGWKSTVLRGPGGYPQGLRGRPANQEAILRNGFRWVSSQYELSFAENDGAAAIAAPSRNQPYSYPTGLVEIPIQSFTDRHWFDNMKNIDREAYAAWRKEHGHRPMPPGCRAPWTHPQALDEWVEYNLSVLDYTYEHCLLWVPVWHPYSHYLHDPGNRMLPVLLDHVAAKPDKVWVCTVRHAAGMLRTGA